jgi:hypothetical protein
MSGFHDFVGSSRTGRFDFFLNKTKKPSGKPKKLSEKPENRPIYHFHSKFEF